MSREERVKAELVAEFEALYEELLSWRKGHPEASYDELAAQVTPRRRTLMGQVLVELACLGSGEELALGVACEECGQEMRYKGEFKRGVIHYLEGEVKLERAYYVCGDCQRNFFPPG